MANLGVDDEKKVGRECTNLNGIRGILGVVDLELLLANGDGDGANLKVLR